MRMTMIRRDTGDIGYEDDDDSERCWRQQGASGGERWIQRTGRSIGVSPDDAWKNLSRRVKSMTTKCITGKRVV